VRTSQWTDGTILLAFFALASDMDHFVANLAAIGLAAAVLPDFFEVAVSGKREAVRSAPEAHILYRDVTSYRGD
jgi:hypothetical protein